MNTTKTITSAFAFAAMSASIISALPAHAQTVSIVTAVPSSISANVTASASVSTSAAKLSTLISKGDADITARISVLTKLHSRIQELKNVSDAVKASISTEIQTNISGLTSLQTKLGTETDLASAKVDAAAIFGNYRIYALVIPRGYLIASADRITTIASMMSSVSTKIQARITSDQNAGKDVSSVTASLVDMNAKIADANVQATAAETAVAGLSPDQGDKAVAASNRTALVSARTHTKAANADLKAARADIKNILQELKSFGSVSASSSASTSVTAQ